MIFTDRTITIRNNKSTINEPVVLYRGDYEVSIRFTIMESKFRFKSGVNLVDSEKASHGQLAILAPYGGNVFSEIVKCEDGTVTFTLTKEMIDQLEEVGLYSFQIRLFDYYRESRVSIPPVEFGIEVREPVASEDHDNEVNNAIVGYSIAKVVDPSKEDVGDTFDANGRYNKTNWETGDRISEGKLNKIEDALDKINQNERKDVAVLDKRITNNYNVVQSQINNLVLESGGDSNLEVVQARKTYSTLNDRLNASDNALGGISILSNNIIDCNNIFGKTVSEIWTDGTWATVANVSGLLENNVDYYVGVNDINSFINYRTVDINGAVVAQRASGKLNSPELSKSHALQLYLSAANKTTYADTVINQIYMNKNKNYGYDVFTCRYDFINETDNLKKEIDTININLGEKEIISKNLADDSISRGKTLGEIWPGNGWVTVATLGGTLKNNTTYYIGLVAKTLTIFSVQLVDENGERIMQASGGVVNAPNLSDAREVQAYISSANLDVYRDMILEGVYVNEGQKYIYDEFKTAYTEIVNIANKTVKDVLVSQGAKPFPQLEKIYEITGAAMTYVGNEICCIATSPDDHNTFTNITFRNSENMEITKILKHNWGHANTVDYNSFSDSLILGNGSQNTIEDIGEIYIIENFTYLRDVMSDGSQLPLDDYAIMIDLKGYDYGYKANVIWGESNGGAGDICYLITSDMRYIRKLQLGKGDNDLGLGQFFYNDGGGFNGSFKVIQTWENDLGNIEQIQDAQFYNGKIYAAFGHYGNTIKEFELLENGSINVVTRKELLYDAQGEIKTDRYSQGICISKKGTMYFCNAKTIGVYLL